MAPSVSASALPSSLLPSHRPPHASPVSSKRRKMETKRPAPASPDSVASSQGAASSGLHDEHALLAAYETRPTRPKRSSSERSKEFRAKRKKYEGELQHAVDAMRREVAELNMRRNIWQEKLVHVRNNVSGSLIKLVREYYLVFQHGISLSGPNASIDNPKAKYQLDFLAKSMDPNIEVGENIGIPALVDQWRMYTTAYPSLFVEVGDVTFVGPDEDPVVLLGSRVHVQFSRKSFEVMYAGALEDEELLNKFLDKQVTYDCLTFFRFTADGRIRSYDHHLGLLEGLMGCGESIEDVVKLASCFCCKALSPWKMEPDNDSVPMATGIKVESIETVVDPTENHDERSASVNVKMESTDGHSSDDSDSERRKLSMNFLLS